MNIKNIFRNISPAVAVMVVGVLGAYLVYNNYFSGTDTASVVGAVEPAAGDDTAAAPAAAAPAGDAMAAPAADATAAAPAAADATAAPVVTVDANGCTLGADGKTTLDADGNCVKPKTDENGCLVGDDGKTTTMGADGNCVKPVGPAAAAPATGDVTATPPTEGEDAAPAAAPAPAEAAPAKK